ncbi:MAG: relaxase/mobilization nuclease domain-containing protein, partial [Steroidobacteraceae bacterium]
MPSRMIDVRDGRALLDIFSYGRPGPGLRDRLSTAEIECVRRTVCRAPEVMIKVLSRGGQNLAAVRRHVDYLSRRGELEIETDDGERLQGKELQRELLDDWDLDLDDRRRQSDLSIPNGRRAPKLVHKLLFSMPPGTPPEKVLAAVRDFAREEFALKHRYAMVLHTDEPHPHVHMIVKAVNERGERLNIRKNVLRHWRTEFARYLRAHGVAANATERIIRGETRPRKLDGIYRATLRGESTHMRERVESVVADLSAGSIRVERDKVDMLKTRRHMERGWRAIGQLLA